MPLGGGGDLTNDDYEREPKLDADPNFGETFQFSDWLEEAALKSTGRMTFTRESAFSSVTGFIPFDKYKAFCRFALGWQYVDSDTKRLKRHPPVQHPIYAGLWASEINPAQGFGCLVNGALTTAEPMNADRALPYGKFEKFQVTVNFKSLDYDVLTDEEVAEEEYPELKRYIIRRPEPYVDVLEFQQGQVIFDFAETPDKKCGGKPVANSQVIRSGKSLYTVTMKSVPLDFLADPDGHSPKLLDGMGKIGNDPEFLGKPGVCFIFDEVSFTDQKGDPVTGDAIRDGRPYLTVDAHFKFKFWDPERGIPADTRRGWQLMLAVDGKGYPGRRSEGPPELFQQISLRNLFRHWSV